MKRPEKGPLQRSGPSQGGNVPQRDHWDQAVACSIGEKGNPRLSATALQVSRPRWISRPASKRRLSRTAEKPLLAKARPNGSVALFKAWLDVSGTAPGMLATQ